MTTTPSTADRVLGRVAAPSGHEGTSGKFFFWVDRNQGVERTQIVATTSNIGGRDVAFIGVVQEVYRRSRQTDISESQARFDGRASDSPPFDARAAGSFGKGAGNLSAEVPGRWITSPVSWSMSLT